MSHQSSRATDAAVLNTSVKSSSMSCVSCGKPLSPRQGHCPVCRVDNGAPNVRQAEALSEKAALDARVRDARSYCTLNELDAELALLESEASTSRAVMTRSYSDTIKLLESNLNFYVSFAVQVDSDARLPVPASLDDVRRQWENAILPNYSDKVLFASLSINDRGLRNYGGVDIVLQEFAMRNRATVFERNGFDFAHLYTLAQTIPVGFRATWGNRAKVVIAKLHKRLSKGIGRDQIDDLLQVDAGGGADDDFVEVHVFEGVNSDAFEKVLAAPRNPIEQKSWELCVLLAQRAGITSVKRS